MSFPMEKERNFAHGMWKVMGLKKKEREIAADNGMRLTLAI